MRDLPDISGLVTELNEAGVLRITLARPPLNLLTQDLRHALGTLFGEVPPEVRAVVLTGSSETFCAGADMTEFSQRFERATACRHGANGHRMMRNLVRCPVPVIAAVEGPCLGGGYELALACDWIVAGQGARLGLPEIKRGIFPGTAGIPLLARRLGVHAARMAIMAGAMVDADEARQQGMIDELVPQGDALQRATTMSETIAASPAQAIRAIKRLGDHDFLDRFDSHLMAEIDAFEDIFQTADAREGCAAFFDKRTPQWVRPKNGPEQ
ncbi:enoyl-CoA hydratase/isomerase family protein [Oceanicola sp. 502str15]|uniref:enoyl-CoA hydratase/isomerase family protein n=1 Tax=Oceanicola sp. 502str15 TaxID=2696061 RepID=UPI0020962080|nr:enoyl-CoA hydratase/isomerase family protein [Oceanicola sp. 502str15]MCO6384937.1 hypothetical protein [Oceanicola sp. 502str15]